MSKPLDPSPKSAFAPANQTVLPGYKRHIPSPPIDYRKWTDGRGSKVDSPAYRGRTSAEGKLIPPLVGEDNQPIRLGTLQIVRDARGIYVVVDWSKPFFAGDEQKALQADGNEDDSPIAEPLMGKQVCRTPNLKAAKTAMAVLHQAAEDRRQGLPVDPAPCCDLAGKLVQIDHLSLRRFARGKLQGRYAVVDDRFSIVSNKRVLLLKATRFKEAVFGFERERKRRATAPPKPRRFTGAPIAFSAPSGGFGNSFVPFDQREYPEPGSVSWKTAVDLYAQNGRWPRSAEYPTGRPAALEAEAQEARATYLAEQARPSSEDVAEVRSVKPAAKLLTKLSTEDKRVLNQVLERFGGVLLSVERPVTR